MSNLTHLWLGIIHFVGHKWPSFVTSIFVPRLLCIRNLLFPFYLLNQSFSRDYELDWWEGDDCLEIISLNLDES